MIKLRVADAVLGLAVGGTIGEFSVDLMLVYRKQHHEIHEQWVGLSRAPNAKDLMQQQDSNLAKLRGYLLVSIAVLGPGDKQHLRSRDEERLAAKKTKVAAVGRGVDSLVMMPPSIKQKVVFLELQLLRAEHLPRVEMFTKFTRALGKLLDNSAIQPCVARSLMSTNRALRRFFFFFFFFFSSFLSCLPIALSAVARSAQCCDDVAP